MEQWDHLWFCTEDGKCEVKRKGYSDQLVKSNRGNRISDLCLRTGKEELSEGYNGEGKDRQVYLKEDQQEELKIRKELFYPDYTDPQVR